MDRARHAIEALADLAPKTALVRRDGAEVEVPVEELLRGDEIVVKPGQRLPADGKVTEGNSAVDQSPVTGELVPVDKAPGDAVFTGTVNGDGVLLVEVTKLATESTLARMVRLVSDAQTQKSPTQNFTDRIERVFVPVVLIGAGLLIARAAACSAFPLPTPFIGRWRCWWRLRRVRSPSARRRRSCPPWPGPLRRAC